jgi:SAM-dependent methyltransferase
MVNPTKRFSSRVENYVRFRPSYPSALIDWLHDDCGLRKDALVADVGSGTGKLAELFLANGNRVFGIEPNREMRLAGELLLNKIQNFSSFDGSAEATTLPNQSVDFVTAGQAFHWFDRGKAREEFLRILKPNGQVVLIWNDRRDATPFLAEYEIFLRNFGTDYQEVNHRHIDAKMLDDFFHGPPSRKIFFYAQRFDFSGLKGRLLSSSYAPEAGQSKYEKMLVALREIFDAHQQNGHITFEYDTRAFCGRLI